MLVATQLCMQTSQNLRSSGHRALNADLMLAATLASASTTLVLNVMWLASLTLLLLLLLLP
jgi:hypothetical protein